MSASRRSGTTDELGPDEPEQPERDGADLLAALLDGMDAALCAFDADGVVTHWNREAERILGWSAAEAVGRQGFAGWAVRRADAGEVEERLLSAMRAPGRQVHEFALLTKDGGRVLVVFQPHLFSRTRDFLDEFAASLTLADVVVVCGIYPAREDAVDFPGVTASVLADRVRLLGHEVTVVEDLRDTAAVLARLVRPGDLVLTIGAGSVTGVGPDLVAMLGERP